MEQRPGHVIREKAIESGMFSLLHDGLIKAQRGDTSLQEILENIEAAEKQREDSEAKLKEYDEIINLEKDVDVLYQDQFYNTTDASNAAEKMLDLIETSLISQGDSLRYTKNMYL